MVREAPDGAEEPGAEAGPARIIAGLKARIDQLGAELESERHGHDFTRTALEAERKALGAEKKALEAANKRIGVLEAAALRAVEDRQRADKERERVVLAEKRLADRTRRLGNGKIWVRNLLHDKGARENTLHELEAEIQEFNKYSEEFVSNDKWAINEAREAIWDHKRLREKIEGNYGQAIRWERKRDESLKKVLELEQRCQETETRRDKVLKQLNEMRERFGDQGCDEPGPSSPRP